MPKIWMINAEEVVPENDLHYEKIFVPKVFQVLPRFFFSLEPGDKIIIPVEVDTTFATYVSKISQLGNPEEWIIKLTTISKPYSLAKSLICDHKLILKLKEEFSNKEFIIEPYIETPGIIKISFATGIPTSKTDPQLVLGGVISKLNDKGVFKNIVNGLGIKTIGGYLVNSIEAALEAIEKVSQENNDRIIIRKTLYAGGFGNLSGNKELLIKELPSWYNGERLLIEPFLNINKIYGSLSMIDAEKISFLGVDEQYFFNGIWTGLDFPSQDAEICEKIRVSTEKITFEFYRQGVRGFVNIDWITTKENIKEPLATECNIRNNGFGYVLDFAMRYFKIFPSEIHIRYREGIPCPNLNFYELVKKIEKVSLRGEPLLIDEPDKKSGVAIMTPPINNKCAIGIFSRDASFINEATLAISDALS